MFCFRHLYALGRTCKSIEKNLKFSKSLRDKNMYSFNDPRTMKHYSWQASFLVEQVPTDSVVMRSSLAKISVSLGSCTQLPDITKSQHEKCQGKKNTFQLFLRLIVCSFWFCFCRNHFSSNQVFGFSFWFCKNYLTCQSKFSINRFLKIQENQFQKSLTSL